jgi:hypothetical protein
MNDFECGRVRDLIPGFVGSRLTPEDLETVEVHLTDCGDCRAELELAQTILASRPIVPDGLLAKITAAVTGERRSRTRPWWGLSAAAVAALALGIGLSSQSEETRPDVPGFAYEAEEGDVWLSDDGLVAGAPLFDGLSDEALLTLLDEITLGAAGGSA